MKTILLFLLVFGAAQLLGQMPRVALGRIERIPDFPSKYVAARNVDIWLPEDYDSTKKYKVLYMQDGQMLFDSSINWNHQEWQVDETIDRMIRAKQLHECIVVAIWNTGNGRHADYFPQKPFETLTDVQKDVIYSAARNNGYSVFNDTRIHSDNYLKFIVLELKPYIDKTYATRSDRKHTYISGSSMGGLISIYAICEYPGIFGGAACLSTHWPGIFTLEANPIPAAFLNYLSAKLPDPKTHKIYFDYGDQTLDAMYPPLQKKVDDVMQKRGYSAKNWTTRFYPGADHSERAWSQRFDIPLLFLLGK